MCTSYTFHLATVALLLGLHRSPPVFLVNLEVTKCCMEVQCCMRGEVKQPAKPSRGSCGENKRQAPIVLSTVVGMRGEPGNKATLDSNFFRDIHKQFAALVYIGMSIYIYTNKS